MSNHLRHCPKHRKPLPCTHCALAVKPAPVETLEAASMMEIRITRCEPGKANARPVPRSVITPEVRRAIETSLALPVKDAPAIHQATVETSHGTKTVAAVEDRVVDVDDAAEQGFLDKYSPRNTKTPAPPRREPAKQPAYLKSVAQPVVPSTNPDAPFGYDENDRPIGVPAGRPYKKPVQTGSVERGVRGPLCKCNQPLCRYCHPETVVQPLTGLQRAGAGDGWGRRMIVISEPEATLRRLFGERIPYNTIILKPSKRHYEFVDYVKMFQLTRTDLVEILNAQIDTERVEDVLDTTQPKQKILKPSGNLKQEINATETKIRDAEKRIAEIGDQIKESENLIDGRSVHKMKLQVKRCERQPDDILDKATREKFKREEKQKINQLEEERSNLRQQLNADKQRVVGLQERLDTWGLRDEDYDERYPRVVREYPIHFGDKFVPPNRDEFEGILPPGYEYGANGYAQIVREFGGEYRTSGEDTLFRHWRQFENELVLQAIGWGLIQPSGALLKKHPTLTTYIDMNAAAMNVEPEEIESDDAENALIFKTGGAQIGGQIYSAGTRWDGTQRSLSSFDGPIGRGKYEEVGDGGNDSSDVSSDDFDSYQPD